MNVQALQTVPHLVTANNGPLQLIESSLLERQSQIEAWFRRQWQQTPAPFYASVDLRNAGFKLAPVDTNLFPAGFNNLNPRLLPLAYQAVQAVIQRISADSCEVLIIPENHTRNLHYLESVATLQHIITQAGFEVHIGSLLPGLTESKTFELPSGQSITLEPVQRSGNKISINGSNPCLILLNNDMSGGTPTILEDLDQPIIPPTEIGWASRLKSGHFAIYRDIAAEFAKLIELDPWLIDPLMRNCGCIDFMKHEGYECIEKNVAELLAEIQLKYNEYGIDKKPFVFIKADTGTYGMGIMTVSSVEEIGNLNRKQRTRMAATKEGQKLQKVIIQEGIYTSESTQSGAVAEPVAYMVGEFVIGGFYRVHTGKSHSDNLNSPGMHFEPLAFAEPCNSPNPDDNPGCEPNRFYAYGVISRLALLAAAKEIAALKIS